ncbi:MAG: hypothetical protein GX945_12380 [Lentisphaerae bacterium]|nr:hypothetical protein [Lentisphaerota bacterium]
MLLLGIVLWVNLVYSLRVAVEGLFSYELLQAADDALLERATSLFSDTEMKLEESEWLFVRRLVISSLVETLALFLEIALVGYLSWHGTQRPLALAVLLKDLIYVGAMLRVGWQQSATGELNLQEIKGVWQRWQQLERACYWFSAAAMGWLLYKLLP